MGITTNFVEFKEMYRPATEFGKAALEEVEQQLNQSNPCSKEHAQMREYEEKKMMVSKFTKENALKTPKFWNSFQTFAALETQALQKRMDQNFGLTEEAFNKMAAELHTGDKTMFKLVFLAHFASCRDYLIVHYGTSAEDAYDATMDTLMEFHHRMLEGKIRYGNLRYLFTKMATQIYLKTRRKNNKTSGLQDDMVATMIDEGTYYDQETENLLFKAWTKLGENCQKILKAFYYDNTSLNTLATAQGKDHAAMRKQKQRCVESLRLNFMRFF